VNAQVAVYLGYAAPRGHALIDRGKAWQRLSAGAGAKGHRWYDWAWVTISDPGPGHRHLLIRRNRRTGELAFYRCYSLQQVTLAALVTVAGLRWTIERA
jgi:hypothetical protein